MPRPDTDHILLKSAGVKDDVHLSVRWMIASTAMIVCIGGLFFLGAVQLPSSSSSYDVFQPIAPSGDNNENGVALSGNSSSTSPTHRVGLVGFASPRLESRRTVILAKTIDIEALPAQSVEDYQLVEAPLLPAQQFSSSDWPQFDFRSFLVDVAERQKKVENLAYDQRTPITPHDNSSKIVELTGKALFAIKFDQQDELAVTDVSTLLVSSAHNNQWKHSETEVASLGGEILVRSLGETSMTLQRQGRASENEINSSDWFTRDAPAPEIVTHSAIRHEVSNSRELLFALQRSRMSRGEAKALSDIILNNLDWQSDDKLALVMQFAILTSIAPEPAASGEADQATPQATQEVLYEIQVANGLQTILTVARNQYGEFVLLDEAEPNSELLTRDGAKFKKISRYQAVLEAAKRQEIPEGITDEVLRILSYEFDLNEKTSVGDYFRVAFRDSSGSEPQDIERYFHIAFVEVQFDRKSERYYQYNDPKDNITSFYNSRGESVYKFLRVPPIEEARTTSLYGYRVHPISKQRTLHAGVDYASKYGAKVFSAQDGVVTTARRLGGYGITLRIRHRNGYSTGYSHLKGFRKGLKSGTVVKRGEHVAYLGSTGLSTGPHVHFEVFRNKKRINPSKIAAPDQKSLSGDALREFLSRSRYIDNVVAQAKNPLDG